MSLAKGLDLQFLQVIYLEVKEHGARDIIPDELSNNSFLKIGVVQPLCNLGGRPRSNLSLIHTRGLLHRIYRLGSLWHSPRLRWWVPSSYGRGHHLLWRHRGHGEVLLRLILVKQWRCVQRTPE